MEGDSQFWPQSQLDKHLEMVKIIHGISSLLRCKNELVQKGTYYPLYFWKVLSPYKNRWSPFRTFSEECWFFLRKGGMLFYRYKVFARCFWGKALLNRKILIIVILRKGWKITKSSPKWGSSPLFFEKRFFQVLCHVNSVPLWCLTLMQNKKMSGTPYCDYCYSFL